MKGTCDWLCANKCHSIACHHCVISFFYKKTKQKNVCMCIGVPVCAYLGTSWFNFPIDLERKISLVVVCGVQYTEHIKLWCLWSQINCCIMGHNKAEKHLMHQYHMAAWNILNDLACSKLKYCTGRLHVDLYVSEDFFISGKELGHSKTLRGKTKKTLTTWAVWWKSAVRGNNEHTLLICTELYTRQYASATWVTHGLRMGCICSPPLACWKINAVEQCSLLLNNVWMGCSRGRLDKGRKERTILLSLTSSACYSRYEVSERGSKLARTHTPKRCQTTTWT